MAARRPNPPIYTALAHGRVWDLANPSPMDVDWRAIAAGLAKICRFSGATISHYSVAQHSIIVSRQLPPELRLYGLLHDAHEVAFMDLTRPMREALVRLAGANARKLAELEMAQMEAIHRAAGLAWPCTDAEMAVLQADNRALTTEWRDVMAEGADTRPYGPSTEHRRTFPALPAVIRPWPEAKAADAFTKELAAAFKSAALPTPATLKPAA